MNRVTITPPWKEPFLAQMDRTLYEWRLEDAYWAEQLDGIIERRSALQTQIRDSEVALRVFSVLTAKAKSVGA